MKPLSIKAKIIWLLTILAIGLIIYSIMNISMYSLKGNPHTRERHYYFLKELKDKDLTTINDSKLSISSLAFYKNKNACGLEEPKSTLEVNCLVIAIQGTTSNEAKNNTELLINNLKNNTFINSQYSGLSLVIFPTIPMNNYTGGVTRHAINFGYMKLDQPYRFKFGN